MPERAIKSWDRFVTRNLRVVPEVMGRQHMFPCETAQIAVARRGLDNHVLTPGRYVGAADVEDDSEPFDETMQRMTAELKKQMEGATELDSAIAANLTTIMGDQ